MLNRDGLESEGVNSSPWVFIQRPFTYDWKSLIFDFYTGLCNSGNCCQLFHVNVKLVVSQGCSGLREQGEDPFPLVTALGPLAALTLTPGVW